MGSKTFRQLQAKWYRKLEDVGFVDIEKNDDDLKIYDGMHFQNPSNYSGYKKSVNAEHLEKQKYFERAKELLNRDCFIDGVERRIWALHTIGYPIRRIVAVLASEGTRRNKNEVNVVLNELQRLMFK